MRSFLKLFGLAACVAAGMATAAPAAAQAPSEYGIDAGAVFGFGDRSSINISLPASRFRIGYPLSPQWTFEPVAGLAYNKTQGTDGVLIYNLEAGALYNLRPFTVVEGGDATTVTSAYLRPFLGLNGHTGGSTDDTELSAGAGVGVKVPWQPNLSWRLEVNVGYGFDNEAARLGLLAGLSFFPR